MKMRADAGWLSLLAQTSPVGIYRCDARGHCLYINRKWCELTGLTSEQAYGTGWESAIHPDDRERIKHEWAHTARDGAPFRSEYRYLRPDGSVVWVFGEVVEERDARGRTKGIIGTVTDITDLVAMREEINRARNELEQTVRERTRQLREVAMAVEQSDDAIVRSDLRGLIVGWNRGAERMFGYSASEMIGRSSLTITPAEDHPASIALKERVRSGHSAQAVEVVRVRRDGTPLTVALSIYPLRDEDGTIIGTSAILRDLTEQKRAELRLRQLSRRLLRVQDEERRRIARDLHDSTAQLLAALSINLGRVLGDPTCPHSPTCARVLGECAELVERVAQELRTQAYLLHPPLLEERGLVAALRVFIEGFVDRSGVRVKFTAPRRLARLDKTTELALFRVVQEALTNVQRHSGSASADIRLRCANKQVTLTIRDRGRGLPAEAREASGVGLAGMRERLHELGGTLSVTTARPGVCITASLPVPLRR